MGNVLQVVPPVEKFSRNGLQPFVRPFISHYVTDFGQPDQYAGTVFVTQATLYIEFGKQFIVDAASMLRTLRQLVNDVFFLHNSNSITKDL